MAYSTIVTGTTISSSWANADVRDQVIVPFASTAARSSAITSPVTGQCSTLTTNLATEGLYLYNSAGEWRGPWNLSWGLMVRSSTTTAVSTSGTTETVLQTSGSFTAVANRNYLVTCTASLTNSVNADAFSVALRVDSTGGASITSQRFLDLSTASQHGHTPTDTFTTTAGAHTVVLTGTRVAGTGVLSTLAGVPTTFNIIDAGPSGAPS